MAAVLYCTYCGSSNLEPYLIIYKCLDCGRVVRKPIIIESTVEQPSVSPSKE